MPEEVLFKTERREARADIAAMLRSVADKLDAGEPITLKSGTDSVDINPPARPTFEVKVERETGRTGPGEMSVEFEIEWDEGASGEDAGLSIE